MNTFFEKLSIKVKSLQCVVRSFTLLLLVYLYMDVDRYIIDLNFYFRLSLIVVHWKH